MSLQTSLDPGRTAVLSMDMQKGIVSRYAGDQDALVSRCAEVLQRSRSHSLCVIHVQVGFRPGLPEVSERNPLFSAILKSPQHQQMFQGEGGSIHPGLAPQKRDIVVTKHRVSAFSGTDLEMILRASEIHTLVLFGIATSGVVLSTLLEASDADYRLVAIKDCCADTDAELHACLLEKLFPRRAEVVTAAEFLEALDQPRKSAPSTDR